MPERINGHVERLHRYLPFSPDHDQIYEEYQRTEDSLNIETRALQYLIRAVEAGARFIVLTGDAGHGKTHLCRRLIERHLGYSEDEARELINTACDGRGTTTARSGRPAVTPLRIYKDFSELTVPLAATQLEEAARREGEVAIICVNEGRLRAVLESGEAGSACAALLEDFRRSFHDGLASRDGEIHFVNLNFQSVAAGDGESLISRALQEWLSGTRWRTCQDCDSRQYCPIYHNRNMLSPQVDESATRRREKLEAVFATIERLGIVVTIREMLMSIAYLLTGGMRCADVHDKVHRKREGWQQAFAFYNLLFRAPRSITRDQLARIPVMPELSRLDPGMRAARAVDERLINQQDMFGKGEIDTLFEYQGGDRVKLIDAGNGIDEIVGNPRNVKERRVESTFVVEVVRSLRRRAFFDEDAGSGTVMRRLGFEHGDDFLEVLKGKVTPQRMASLKNRIIAGLHTVQGLQIGTRQTTLYLVDPAFGSATAHAAIIARRIPAPSIRLMPMSEAWSTNLAGAEHAMTRTVDWLDRHVVLRIEHGAGEYRDFALDLMVFDSVGRAASGYMVEDFYAHDVRRITNFLGRLAERADDREGDISMVIHGRMHSVSIDEGVIQVGGGQ